MALCGSWKSKDGQHLSLFSSGNTHSFELKTKAGASAEVWDLADDKALTLYPHGRQRICGEFKAGELRIRLTPGNNVDRDRECSEQAPCSDCTVVVMQRQKT